MTLHEWLAQATQKLESVGIGSATLDSELILAHALNRDRAYLHAHTTDPLPPDTETAATNLLERRVKNEPIAYLLGEREFYGLTFKTDARALIPRGETEPLVEAALTWLKTQQTPITVAEVGTGSGIIITTLAKHAPQHAYYATELDQAALDLAVSNAEQHEVAITFYQGDLGTPLIEHSLTNHVNLLVANLPYIPSSLLTLTHPTVQYYEPHLALDGGEDGLELYRRFLPQAKELLAPGGLLLCEHEFDQGETMRQLARTTFPTADIRTLQDSLGHDRVLYCHLKTG